MKPDRSGTITRKFRLLAAPLALAALTACGGGGGSGGANSSASALSGVAVDGYLQNATVFLDLNRNGTQDSGEPSTVTDAAGRFSLNYGALEGALDRFPIVVVGGIDSDTGYAFGGRLTARADAAAAGQVVSPLTSLVDALVTQGLAPDVAAARKLVANALGLSADDLTTDPIAAIANQPGIYIRQAALQRAVQMLAAANRKAGESPHQAQQAIIKALAVQVVGASQTGAVSVGQLVSAIAASNTAQGKKLADAIHDALESALKKGGLDSAKAVLKAMDQLRTRMEGSNDYDIAAWAGKLDSEYGLTTSKPFSKLTNTDRSDDDAAIGSVVNLFPRPSTTVAQPANTAGRLLASNCFQCHGTGGVGGFDSIRGGDAGELREFLSKPANGNIMAAHAQGYTSAQIDAIVAYLKQ